MLDFHSHILPWLDDGAPDMDTALEMARIAVEDGITEMVATPHFIEGSMENSKEAILQSVREFQHALDGKAIGLKIVPGAEIYLSPETPERLDRGELMTVNSGSKYLLVELPMRSIPTFTDEILFKLKVRGVTPIIAHPERNLELAGKPERILGLVAKGCLLQINSGSITGQYGEKVKKTARLLVKNDLIHLIGSDAHSSGGRSPKIHEALDIVEKIKPAQVGKLNEYGKRVLTGTEVTPEVPAEIQWNTRNLWERIKSVYSFGGVRQ